MLRGGGHGFRDVNMSLTLGNKTYPFQKSAVESWMRLRQSGEKIDSFYVCSLSIWDHRFHKNKANFRLNVSGAGLDTSYALLIER